MDPRPDDRRLPDPLEHPLYRVAHLHGSTWVTLRPEEQHSPAEDAGGPWDEGAVYRCEECGERVAIAPLWHP
jgi:hypothetical protein